MTYQSYHDFLMWGFLLLGIVFVAFLVLCAVATLVAWCWDRWSRRFARADHDDQPEKFPPTHSHFTRHRLNF